MKLSNESELHFLPTNYKAILNSNYFCVRKIDIVEASLPSGFQANNLQQYPNAFITVDLENSNPDDYRQIEQYDDEIQLGLVGKINSYQKYSKILEAIFEKNIKSLNLNLVKMKPQREIIFIQALHQLIQK